MLHVANPCLLRLLTRCIDLSLYVSPNQYINYNDSFQVDMHPH